MSHPTPGPNDNQQEAMEVMCLECKQPFPQATLREHISIAHANYRAHGCAECEFTTASMLEVEVHGRLKHQATFYRVGHS